jgi:glycosyltransferase involved in cell wall biosynthesis
VRIALLARGFAGWGGGIDFFRIVCGSLFSIAERNGIKFSLVLPGDGPFCRLAAIQIMLDDIWRLRIPRLNWRRGLPDRETVSRSFANVMPVSVQTVNVDSGRWALSRTLKRLGADVVLPVLRSLGRSFPIPWVGYLWDFQHRYFPEFFSKHEIRQRDAEFGRMLAEAKSVITNARSVRADMDRFYPAATARIVSLPFAAAADPDWLPARPDLLERHSLQEPYFLVSNQFWRHKDHRTAIDAFRIVVARNPSISLVCTGSTRDHRDPGYFARLTTSINAAGLSNSVRILGHIPKREQIEIMKYAQAVVQPTLFEGGPGGGAAYDAVSLGVPVIASDIPVNQEIDDPLVTFFRTGDPEDLARRMKTALATQKKIPDAAQLMAAGTRRREQCGTALLDAIRHAMV